MFISPENTFPSVSIDRLHYLTQDLDTHTHPQLAEMACKAGVKWVQLRVKGEQQNMWRETALQVKEICRKFGSRLIINDNVELAHDLGVGVHLGKNDMHPAKARKILGHNAIIGGTVNTAEDFDRIKDADLNYVGIGPYSFTSTKQELSNVLSPVQLQQLIEMVAPLPAIVIGGITIHDLVNIKATGAHGFALSSAINKADEPGMAAKAILDKMKELKWKN